MPHDIIIRSPQSVDEARTFFRLAAYSLLTPEQIIELWMAREGLENVRIALMGNEIVGGLSVQCMGQWFGGKSVPCGVVRVVAVAPEHRGGGIAERLMRNSLLEMREAGVQISMLFPATQVLYRRVGYEQAGVFVEQSAKAADFPAASNDLPLAQVELHDPRLRTLYDERARRSSGLLDRNDWLWRRMLDPMRPSGSLRAYLIGEPSDPEGYLIVSISPASDPLQSGEMRLIDCALLTPEAIVRARTFIAQHRSVIDRVHLTSGSTEPLLIGRPGQGTKIERSLSWMLRLVDVRGALSSRGYSPALDATVHLQVRDDLLSPPEQRWLLRVRGGHAEVLPGGNGAVQIDVRGLAALYTGFLSPYAVAELGYLSGPADQLALLGGIFAGPMPAVHDFV